MPSSEKYPVEPGLREGYLNFLTRLANVYLLVLRAASATLGWDFTEGAWEGFARDHDLPVASTFARASGGGSFRFAKFLAGVGPLPTHPGGPRLKKGQQSGGWTRERLLLGAMTVARMNGAWPPRDGFDDVARKARARGVDVPFIHMILRRLGVSYTELKRAASNLTAEISDSRPGEGVPATYPQADAIARDIALGVKVLGYRPSSETWDDATHHLRARGVRGRRMIYATFGSWQGAWDYVEKLGLDPGIQTDSRPRYTAEKIARGMALVEDRLGHRPSTDIWTDEVRVLKREVGPGVIPAKPTIYNFFASWTEAWLFVDLLRARGIIEGNKPDTN